MIFPVPKGWDMLFNLPQNLFSATLMTATETAFAMLLWTSKESPLVQSAHFEKRRWTSWGRHFGLPETNGTHLNITGVGWLVQMFSASFWVERPPGRCYCLLVLGDHYIYILPTHTSYTSYGKILQNDQLQHFGIHFDPSKNGWHLMIHWKKITMTDNDSIHFRLTCANVMCVTT